MQRAPFCLQQLICIGVPCLVVFDVLGHRSEDLPELLNILLGLELQIDEKDDYLRV